MKNVLILLVLSFTTILFGQSNQATKIFLLRHAETVQGEVSNPSLSDRGKERANNLASILSEENIEMIFSTKYKRTQETATIIAESNGDLKINF